MYEDFGEWHAKPPPAPNETLTVEDARSFWHALESRIDVPAQRWTSDYYQERMEHLYEVMRGRPSEGVTFGTKALTPKQAAEVVVLFSEFLDDHDIRLDVPLGHDGLRSSADGGYVWCEKCGAITDDDVEACRKRKCPIRAERKDGR